MQITTDELRNQLKRREIAPVYVLYGPECHLRDLAVKTIVDRSFSETDLRDFNETSFSLNNDDNLQQALSAAQQLPMMASKRVVRISDVRISATGYRDTLNDGHEWILNGYLSDPSPSAVVIFVADELNGVRKMSKLLKDKALAVEFTRLDEKQFAEWARKTVSEAGAQIDERTLRYLLSRVEQDVSRLTNEIRKLATAALPDQPITADLIDALVPHTRESNNFDLTGHLIAGRREMAVASLRRILEDGAEPLALLGLISYNYRRLLMAKEMMSRGVERREVASAVKLRYSDQEPFMAAARRSELAQLVTAVKLIADTDLAIKSSLGGSGAPAARMQLEVLVCELALM